MNRAVILLGCFTYILAGPVMQYRVVTVERGSDVNRDMQEFINLLPADKIISTVRDYVANDADVADFWKYLHSKSVQDLVFSIADSREYKTVLHHLDSSGLDINKFMIQLHNLLGRVPPASPTNRVGNGLRGLLLSSIKPLIPMTQIKLLATQKYIFSSEFRGLVRIITSKQFKHDVQALVTSNLVKNLESDATLHKVDVKAIYEFIASFEVLYEYLMNL